MRPINARFAAIAALLLALSGRLPAGNGGGQIMEQSPAELIRFLTHQSGRADMHAFMSGVFSCGAANAEARGDRPVFGALVKMGTSAIPAIDAALDSIEAHGQQSTFAFNSALLLRAYAEIRGPAAYPRLRRMLNNQRLAFLQRGIDNALATSLGVTSYVSDSRPLAETAMCSGVFEPRDILDQLIAAWERDDRYWAQASLGPTAKDALGTLLKGTTWEEMSTNSWRGKRSVGVAVGYRFLTPGWWSASDEPLEIDLTQRSPANPEIETQFTNRAGRDCGSYSVKFFQTKEFYVKYLVDNSDLGRLLRAIAVCGTEPGARDR